MNIDLSVLLISVLYGTRHVLVLAGFPPSTRTSDLERLFDKFKDQFVIRWVNDTTALAVFKTPSAGNDFCLTYCILVPLFLTSS